MKYAPIDAQLFIDNRKNFIKHLDSNALAVFNSNDLMPRNGDQTFILRQNSDLFYLSGIDQEESILIIYPDTPLVHYREALFIKRTNAHIAVWEGHKYSKEEARKTSGIKNIYWLEDFPAALDALMKQCNSVFLNSNENDRFDSDVPYKDLRFAKNLQNKFPQHNYKRSAPIMAKLRSIKHSIEVELMQKACDITESAFRRLLHFIKPGVNECEIEAEIMHEFLRLRSNGYAYYPIVASGASSCVLHYQENNKDCLDGDILLLDFGADYANYASDLTRTIPVSGKYSPRQKEVYNATLKVMKEAMSMLRPGITLDNYNKEVGKVMESALIDIKLLDKKDVANQDKRQPLYKKYFMHGTSHFIGLDVHDIGDRYAPIKEGMAFTCEPGIYIPNEGIGVRIENDLIVGKNSNINLMKNIPIEADEIETLMQA